jgi:hypothetical protein
MPARTIFFSFDKNVDLNKENVQAIKSMIEGLLAEEDLQRRKDAFCTEKHDKNFAKFLIKELKSFQGESRDGDYCSDKKRAMLPLVVGALSATRAYTLQANQPVPPLSIKYLFDEWDYEGTGSEDYDYFTYADETAEVKKLSKQAMALVKKLNDMGVKAELAIKHKVPTSEGHAAAYAALNTYLDGLQ